MTSDEVRLVQASWASVWRPERRSDLLDRLAARLGSDQARAAWLLDATGELVALLRCPSELGDRARDLAADPRAARADPAFSVDGRALLAAIAESATSWDDPTARAWLSAWQLLADEVALDRLSPFGDAARR